MTQKTLTGVILDERIEFSLTELCHACSTTTDWVIELVQEGVLEPVGQQPKQWRFSGPSVKRAHAAMRLQADLKINLAGVALALDLIEQIETMRERLLRLEAIEEAKQSHE